MPHTKPRLVKVARIDLLQLADNLVCDHLINFVLHLLSLRNKKWVAHATLGFGENGVCGESKIDVGGAGAQAQRGATAMSILLWGIEAEPLGIPINKQTSGSTIILPGIVTRMGRNRVRVRWQSHIARPR